MGGRNPRARAIRTWLIRQAKRTGDAFCRYCGGLIDLTLSGRHPDGPALDHTVALEDGGDELDPDNCRLVHTRCNSAKENRQRVVRRREAAQTPTASRAW